MTKSIDTEQERTDRDFRNHINGITQERISKIGEQVKESLTKAAEAAEQNRKRKQAREFGCCFLASVGIGCLYLAQAAGLIATVVVQPAAAFCYIYFGYHLSQMCKYGRHK